jgi:hypothetical protein
MSDVLINAATKLVVRSRGMRAANNSTDFGVSLVARLFRLPAGERFGRHIANTAGTAERATQGRVG